MPSTLDGTWMALEHINLGREAFELMCLWKIISTFSLNASIQSLSPVVGFVCNISSFNSLATKNLHPRFQF